MLEVQLRKWMRYVNFIRARMSLSSPKRSGRSRNWSPPLWSTARRGRRAMAGTLERFPGWELRPLKGDLSQPYRVPSALGATGCNSAFFRASAIASRNFAALSTPLRG